MPGTFVFDLETKRLADDVGGWANVQQMGFAAGVTFQIETNTFQHFTEANVGELLQTLFDADAIIGFNLIRFDYQVLVPYGLQVGSVLHNKSVDMLQSIYSSLSFRIGLGNLAEATLGEGKSADGIRSVQWFRQGDIKKVLDYCEQDVNVTYRIWKFGNENGFVRYRDRRGVKRRISVEWHTNLDMG